MTTDEAYAFCRAVARAEARNFYYGFVLLPPERRAGIYAAYAFSRRADDSVDEGGSAGATGWRRSPGLRGELDACAAGTAPPDDPVLVALSDTMRRFSIPRRHLDALIDGVEMDITVDRYADFAALKEYCDRVAGAVGLVSLHIFGFRDPAAPAHAADLGVALQIVNIMRDVAEDAARGRIYLPADEMAAHGVTEDDLIAGRATPGFRALMARQGERAREYFARGERLLPLLDRRSRMCVVDARGALPGDPRRDRGARPRRLRRPRVAVGAPQAAPDGHPHRRGAAVSARPRVVVCGGGLAGIAAACEAAGRGAEVTLIERRPFLGGRAFSFTDPETGREIDNGQHVFLGCCPAYMGLLALLGTIGHTSLQRRLDTPVRDRAGRTGRLRASPLPAPLHLGALLRGVSAAVAGREADGRCGRSAALGALRPAAAAALDDDLVRASGWAATARARARSGGSGT